MSDASRKRSRKSRLVPRQCVEFEDDNATNSQMDPKAISDQGRTADISNDFQILLDSQNQPPIEPSRTFNITIDVEQYDDDSNGLVIDEQALDGDNFNYETDAVFFGTKCTEDPLKEESDLDNRIIKIPDIKSFMELSKNGADETTKTFILDKELVLARTNDIETESNNIADLKLCIEVKNSMGFFQHMVSDTFDEKLHKVFDQWSSWQKLLLPKFRSSPLFYKCYICQKSWWYFSIFYEHIKKHNDFQLDLEEFTLYEANIICYRSVEDIIDMKQFRANGDCPKCGNDYNIHRISNRQNDGRYTCNVLKCIRSFHTCFLLSAHENSCHTFSELTGVALKAVQWKKTCEICDVLFYTQRRYHAHMRLKHCVRSDMVIDINGKKCQFCGGRFVVHNSHECPNKGIMNQCKRCYRLFPGGIRFGIHKALSVSGKCAVCNIELPNRCMEVQHLMGHTSKFVIVKKCILCSELTVFLDDVEAMRHEQVEHSIRRPDCNSTMLRFFDHIIIPKECLKSCASDGQTAVIEKVETIVKEEPIDTIEIKDETNDESILIEAGDEIEGNNDNSKHMSYEEDNMDNDQQHQDHQEDMVIEDNRYAEVHTNMEDFDDHKTVTVKEEADDMVFEDNFDSSQLQGQYSIKMEPQDSIYGIKIEAEEVIHQDMDDESEYEDDIIRLDYNYDMQETKQEIIKEEVQEDVAEEEIDSDDQEDDGTRPPNMYRCHKCGFEATHKDYRNHLKTNCDQTFVQKGIYRCTKCDNVYFSFKKYIEHFVKHGLSEKCCPVCFKVYEHYTALLPHVSMHIRMKFVSVRMITLNDSATGYNFQCKSCKDYINKCDFFAHWEGHLTIVEGADKVVEDQGKGEFARPIDNVLVEKLLDHLQSLEYSDKLRQGCFICHKYFARRNDCKRHLIEHLLIHAYTQRAIYSNLRCQICTRGFQTALSYKKHMRDHGSLPVYKCEICDKTFSDSSNFTKHKKLHNANAFTCDICGKKFQAKYSIEKHMAVHESQKPMACDICNKVFYLESSFKKHNRLLHDKDAQRYPCLICCIKFKRLKDKWDHMWQVHKERKHKADCTLCDKSFRRHIDLKQHMKTDHSAPVKTRALQITKIPGSSGSQNIFELLQSTKIVGIGDSQETLIVYE